MKWLGHLTISHCFQLYYSKNTGLQLRDLDSLVVFNSSNSSIYQKKYFDAPDEEMLKTFEVLNSSNRETSVMGISSITAEENVLEGYFTLVWILFFNLSNRALPDDEIKVLKKGLDFAPIQRKINEPELRSDFWEFCHII